MFKTLRDQVALSGIVVLMMGVALLVFTFIGAYGFLTESLSIIASADLVQTFGEALAPLIATCIRIMYLGVMGWIGSLLTIRGVTLIAHAPKIPKTVPRKQGIAKPVPQKVKAEQPKEKTKPKQEIKSPEPKPEQPKEETKPKEEIRPEEEVKPPEPEVIVVPPEQVSQPPQQPQNRPQENSSSQQPPNY